MNIRIIGVPSAWGTSELGAQRTPTLLREAGLLEWLSDAGHDVVEGGDVPVSPMTTNDLPCGDVEATAESPSSVDTAQLTGVATMARGVREAVSAALAADALPIVLGGECSLGIGVAAALARHRGPLTVAWLDAHGDLNTPETSVSGLLTGMPLAVMLGHGHEELTAVGADGARPRGDKTFLLGGRDLDAGEVRNLADFGIRHLDTGTVRAAGPEEVIMEMLDVPEISVMPPEARAQLIASDPGAAESAAAAPHPNVYLHFDVDVLDPEFAPGVHYRVGGGFDPAEVGTLAGYLSASGCVGAIAVASANLEHDIDGRTVTSIRRVISSVADALATL
jgi:arginase